MLQTIGAVTKLLPRRDKDVNNNRERRNESRAGALVSRGKYGRQHLWVELQSRFARREFSNRSRVTGHLLVFSREYWK